MRYCPPFIGDIQANYINFYMRENEMKNKATTTYKWAYLPFVFSSAAILATTASAGPGASQQYQDARQVGTANYEYVGGRTQIGLGVTDEGDASIDLNQVISETKDSSTSAGLWAGYDLSGDDKGLKGRGVQLNHNWVSRDKAGRATHVNKVFGAYDRNEAGHDKATVGYGQENENLFWDVHASKGLSGKKDPRLVNGKIVRDKAYDYGVGGNIGTFIKGSNVRVRAGLDHEWGTDTGAGESTAKNTTLSAGIEKFFQGTPHSLGLDVAASKRSGGYDNGSDDTDVSGKLSYRYDFGGASIYQPDRRYRRVRVEVPGTAVAPRYAKKAQYRRVPVYKNVSTYGKKTVRTPYKQLVKSTMELEGQTFFKLNSAKLIPSAQTRLRQIANQIRKNGYKGSIRITGNTCGLGNARYDQILSEKRANAVKSFLIKNGFNPNHLVARGLGKGHPKYPNTPDQGFKNRRVDIEYVTERKAFKTGYRTETKTVRTGTRRVVAGFKNVPAGFKNVLIDNGRPGTPRVIWRTEVIPTSPAWITRALHNNIKHNTSVNTYQTTAGSTPVNKAPVAVNDKESIQCSTDPITIDVLGNDRDADGDALTIKSVKNGQFGTTKIVNGMVVYTPNANACGQQDSFEYTITDGHGNDATATVTVDIAAQANQAPVAVDDSATTEQGTPVALNTLANDTDPDGDTLTITSVEDPAHGTAEIVGGQIIYTPDAGFVGTETFDYTISDGNGHSVTATETVTVTAPSNQAPVAEDDLKNIQCSTDPVTIDVLSNDTDPDGDALTIKSVKNGKYGTTKIVNGMVVYTPSGDGCGETDSFEYTITDGNGHDVTATVSVSIADQKNEAPVALDDSATTEQGVPVALNTLANDTDPDGDTLTITSVEDPAHGKAEIVGGQIVYTPDAGFVGTETFDYTISDGNGHSVTATETVIVTQTTPTNSAPVAVNDSESIQCSTSPVTINVLGNDSDIDGDTLMITSVGNGQYGSTKIVNGMVVYTPNGNGCGKTDSFDYTITDGNGHEVTATVTVTIAEQENKAPTAVDDSATTEQGQLVALNTLANDTDPDGDTLTITSVDQPAHGKAEIVGDQIIYTPNADFVGTETFDYTISDGHGHSVTATETVIVKAKPNVAPEANDDTASTGCSAVTIPVLDNDSDPDGDALKIIGVGSVAKGTAVISGNNIVYTPASDCDKGNIGDVSFTYTISDGHGHEATANVDVSVNGEGCNGACTKAVTDEAFTTVDTPVTIDVLANDQGGTTLKVIDVDYIDPSKGSAKIVGNRVVFTPAAGFEGVVSFGYDIEDVTGYQDYATIVVYVEPACKEGDKCN